MCIKGVCELVAGMHTKVETEGENVGPVDGDERKVKLRFSMFSLLSA
jgi:hypothetical protein